ncbi:MAG: hypothetical protein ACLGI5_18775 [Thermoleophilia bacterium]
MATDFLDQKRAEIGTRLRELKPLVAEYERLEAAAAALDAIPAAAPKRRTAPRRAPARPAAATADGAPSSAGRPGRPKGSGRRGQQALEAITDHPGITIPELARKMGIKQNYLYRVLPGLEGERRVRREGRGWHPEHGG